MIVWRILLGVAALLLVVLIIELIRRKPLKIFVARQYEPDQIVDQYRGKKAMDYVFATPVDQYEYIDQYVLSNRKGKKVLIVHYSQKFDNIKYSVVVFNKKDKPIRIIAVHDKEPGDHSKMISLPKHTNAVNLLIEEANGIEFNVTPIAPLKKKKIVEFSIVESVILFLTMFIAHLVLVEFFTGLFQDHYIKSTTMILSNVGIALVAVINFVLVLLVLLIKNRRLEIKDGGLNGF